MARLEEMSLEELVKNLTDISALAEEAQKEQSVHAPPEVQARGKMQAPILLKVESILDEELHRRFGYSELADVAISAMEGHILQNKAREAWDEREHPEVMASCVYDQDRPAVDFDTWHLNNKGRPLAEYQALCIQEEERRRDNERIGNTISERLHVAHESTAAMAALGEERDWTPSQPSQKPIEDGLPRPYALEPSSNDGSILLAMKNAAWASLQRLGTDVLVEYLKKWVVKHHDYGVENHAIWGCRGAVIRATDKLMRLKGQYCDGREMKKVEDEWMDLIGYGLIGLIIEQGWWPMMSLCTVIERMKAQDQDGYERLVETLREEEECCLSG